MKPAVTVLYLYVIKKWTYMVYMCVCVSLCVCIYIYIYIFYIVFLCLQLMLFILWYLMRSGKASTQKSQQSSHNTSCLMKQPKCACILDMSTSSLQYVNRYGHFHWSLGYCVELIAETRLKLNVKPWSIHDGIFKYRVPCPPSEGLE